MKKTILLLFTALFVCLQIAAERKVATYTSFGKEHDIEGVINDNDELLVYITVEGDRSDDEVMIMLRGVNDIVAFRSSLISVRDKYIEWKKVAEDNNVKHMLKPFDFKFPKIEVYWLGTKWYSSFARRVFAPDFLVNDEGVSSVVAGGEAQYWDNEYITQKWYALFQNEDDINSLIDALDVVKIREQLEHQVNVSDLFK